MSSERNIIDLTKDDDDDDAQMEMREERKENESSKELVVSDDEEEIRAMTPLEYDMYIKEKERELRVLDIFVEKFLGVGWKKKKDDILVKMGMKIILVKNADNRKIIGA